MWARAQILGREVEMAGDGVTPGRYVPDASDAMEGVDERAKIVG